MPNAPLMLRNGTLGSALAQYGVELKGELVKHAYEYFDGLRAHFDKHLSLLR